MAVRYRCKEKLGRPYLQKILGILGFGQLRIGRGMTLQSNYFRSLYQRTMREAYGIAHRHIVSSIRPNSVVLDCGASEGRTYDAISKQSKLTPEQYHGIEWNLPSVEAGKKRGLNIEHGDLNQEIAYADGTFSCISALSLIEHLLNPCKFMKECHRVLQPQGQLVLLTPNISTYFTAALILMGKMPSSGPHPDSDALLKQEELFKVSRDDFVTDAETSTPAHRHLVVFSYRVLRDYLRMIGFTSVEGYGFGLYPFPNFMQPALERIDPYHCHQMVFVAIK